MSARRRLTTCQLKWKSMFVLLFVLLAVRGVNNNARLRCQRLSDFNCFDKLPAVIFFVGGAGGGRFFGRHRRNGNIFTLAKAGMRLNVIFAGTFFGLGRY